jgi:fibronectin type 3 domain-containing protein
MDMQTGELSSPVQIVNPVAQELTLILDATGLMHLRWEAVPGAGYYAIYESDDPFEFPPEPTYFTETNEIVLPFADEVKFYRVTAVK